MPRFQIILEKMKEKNISWINQRTSADFINGQIMTLYNECLSWKAILDFVDRSGKGIEAFWKAPKHCRCNFRVNVFPFWVLQGESMLLHALIGHLSCRKFQNVKCPWFQLPVCNRCRRKNFDCSLHICSHCVCLNLLKGIVVFLRWVV